MMPIPQTGFLTHMPQQAPQMPQQPQFQNINPSIVMKPPMPQPMPQQEQQQIRSENPFIPNPILHQIAQQIIAQKIMESQRNRQEQRIPIPEEVLSQINRLPNRDVIVAVQAVPDTQDTQQESFAQEMRVPSQDIRMVPQEMREMPQEVNLLQRQTNSGEQNERQTYAREFPVRRMPIQIIPQESEEPQVAAAQEPRLHGK